MSIQAAYNDWSATYDSDRNLTRDLDQKVTRQTLFHLRFKSILEIGCGTGKNTALLAEIADHVRALDFSEGMIQQAKAKLRLDHVTFAVADLTQRWPTEDSSADLVVCNLVLEHISALPFIFSEAARSLTRDGRFFVCELHPFRQYQGVQAHFQREAETTEIAAFVHHLSDFINAARENRLKLESFNEWWHEEDNGKPPRLVSFMFRKRIQ